MFYYHLRNELWKLFGKKRTYIGFGAFLLAQNAMLLAFRFSHWQSDMQRMLAGNGYLAQEYLSALTVFVVMPNMVFAVLGAGQGLKLYLCSHIFMAINASVILGLAFMFSCFNMKP